MERMGESSTKHQLGQQDVERGKACPHRAMGDMRKNHTNFCFYGLTGQSLCWGQVGLRKKTLELNISLLLSRTQQSVLQSNSQVC